MALFSLNSALKGFFFKMVTLKQRQIEEEIAGGPGQISRWRDMVSIEINGGKEGRFRPAVGHFNRIIRRKKL